VNDQEVAATEHLAEMERARQAVGAKAAKEYAPFIGWGLFVLLMLPPFDVVAGKVWGPVILLVGLVGTIATFAYFIRGIVASASRKPIPGGGGWPGPCGTAHFSSVHRFCRTATGGLDGRGCRQRSAAPRRRHPSATPGHRMNHPRSQLDGLIHQPVRFSILAALDAADEVVFGVLRTLWASAIRCCRTRSASWRREAMCGSGRATSARGRAPGSPCPGGT